MINRDELGTSSCFQESQTDGVIWCLSLVGATVFVAASKVSLLLHFIEDKRWYGDFMTFAVSLAMGTMFAVTIFQFIPESLHFLHAQSYNVSCESCHDGSWASSIVDRHNCLAICNMKDFRASDLYRIDVGGASSFMSTMSISYFFFIFVYDIQKIIQSLFSKEYTGGANYRSLNRRSTVRINNSVAPTANLAERKPGPRSSHGSGFKPQDWKYVDTDAWVILLTTSLECFIEGMAFTLTLQDDIGAGFSVLFAMLLKMIPQKLGNAVILMQSGLSTFWESLFVLLSVSAIYPGVCIAMILRNMHIKAAVKAKFFAALTGMFLYISLARMFPTMQELVDAPPKENRVSSKGYHQLAKRKIYWRLFIANVGFVSAFGILTPLIYFENQIQEKIEEIICDSN